VDTVGVLTQYQPLRLNQHIGIGIPWDLDRRSGGVTILSPHMKAEQGAWYTGTANAIYQNIEYIEQFNPDYVLVLGGDHIYKMDYSEMLTFHKKNKADVTIAALQVSWEEAPRFGLMNTEDDHRIFEFEEKPPEPKSNLANMGIYIFSWAVLRDALERDNKIHPNSDFGMHVLPMLLAEKKRMFAFPFAGYWRDVGTIESYWEANMDLIKTVPDFNLYEEFNKIYTDDQHQPPIYTGPNSQVQGAILSEGCEVLGMVTGSVLGRNVIVEEGAKVINSIIMEDCYIGKNSSLERCIVDVDCTIGDNVVIGCAGGGNVPNKLRPKIYSTGISVIGEHSVIPDGVRIGQNCVVFGETQLSDFPDKLLPSGESILRNRNQEGGTEE
jgi:glucose-1-phosphate adenylyltransferase